ncbi:MAG: bifunctional nuclease family protein [Candidatus Rokubacteria bacterium]|nr:bifunctional nuclease family protein [Candidatus Rokubacteria bacterium]
MTQMRIVNLTTCQSSQAPMVILEDQQRSRWLAFYLPLNEANRLARVLGKTPCASVPIFELLERLCRVAEIDVLQAEIDGSAEGVSATVVFRTGQSDVSLECHPADAMALATRAGAPVLASEAALAHASPVDPDVRAEVMRHWLDALSPADFAGEVGL